MQDAGFGILDAGICSAHKELNEAVSDDDDDK